MSEWVKNSNGVGVLLANTEALCRLEESLTVAETLRHLQTQINNLQQELILLQEKIKD